MRIEVQVISCFSIINLRKRRQQKVLNLTILRLFRDNLIKSLVLMTIASISVGEDNLKCFQMIFTTKRCKSYVM